MSTQTTTTTESGIATLRIDPAHTQAEFEVKHMMFARVRGSFRAVEGTIHLAPEDAIENSRVEATIEAASIDTGEDKRDEHLRSADFFDVERHPELRFESSSVRRADDGDLLVTGGLTIRGETREVELEVEETGRGTDPWGNERVGFTATTKIDRREFGLEWNQALETGGVLVGHEIRITLEIQAVQEES
jgi:polyisoprenoid-binding protein YceI